MSSRWKFAGPCEATTTRPRRFHWRWMPVSGRWHGNDSTMGRQLSAGITVIPTSVPSSAERTNARKAPYFLTDIVSHWCQTLFAMRNDGLSREVRWRLNRTRSYTSECWDGNKAVTTFGRRNCVSGPAARQGAFCQAGVPSTRQSAEKLPVTSIGHLDIASNREVGIFERQVPRETLWSFSAAWAQSSARRRSD